MKVNNIILKSYAKKLVMHIEHKEIFLYFELRFSSFIYIDFLPQDG